jgi:4-alpha-glucanotransferase
MKFNRASGILLHPTSLSGANGIGDLGPAAYQWVDFLSEAGCSYWQVLPLGPTGYGDSPYQCFSAFAGNPYLVSPTLLLDDGLLSRRDLEDRPDFPSGMIDFGSTINWKLTLLRRAFEQFCTHPIAKIKTEFETFQKEEAGWLEDFCLFMAIKEAHFGGSWGGWEVDLRKRNPQALAEFKADHEKDVQRFAFQQFLFFRQWTALRKYAAKKNIRIIGDAPIFVAYDSADAWSHPELFYLDKQGQPTVVAGVPPDYFSPTGQLWGNPLYRWDAHAKEGYQWWIERLKATLKMVDIVRLDHFRGFAGYWEVPAGNPTAEIGKWVKGPGEAFFDALMAAFGDLPLIAEDLGEITPDVIALRDRYAFPGMRIFQFAFGSGPSDKFLPHNYTQNSVVYTGTHDNDTARGWYDTAPEKERDFCRRYLARSGEDISWDMIRSAWSSVACLAVAPLQDLLSLGSEARMNFPGKASGNWGWRMPADALNPWLLSRLRETNYLYGRLPKSFKMPED